MRRPARTLAILLAIVVIISAAAATADAATPAAAATAPASRSQPAAAPIKRAAVTAAAPPAAAPIPIPDFEPFSPEEEEQVINLPAREEIGGGPTTAAAATSPQAAKPKPVPPKPSPSLPTALPIVSLDVSGDTRLRVLCASLPLQPSPAASAAASLALPHLTQLLKALWVGSGLLDAGVGDHLLRVRVGEVQRQQLEAAFRSSSVAASASGGRLREEDLPELFDASMAVLRTMDIDLEAEARLDGARDGGQGGLAGLSDDFSPHLSSRPGGAGAPSVWNAPLHLLRLLGLHPTSQDEVDAFWFISCILAVVCASIGVGWALGRRGSGAAESLAAEVNESLAAGRRKRRKQIWVAVGWIALGCAVVALIALVAGISQELAEERRRLITKRALAQASGPPKGCREGETLSWWHEIARSWRAEDDDPCVAYLERVERSIQPDRFRVATNYVFKHTIVLLARIFGDSVAAVLSSQTYLVQMMLPLLLVALFAVLVALGTPAMIKAMMCCCCARGDRDSDGDGAARRNNRARLGSAAGSSARRRLKGEQPARRRHHELIESASDSEVDSEAEAQQQEQQQRLIRDAVRAALTEATASSSSSSSSSARAAPRLTSGGGGHRSSRRPSSRDTSPVRSRSRSRDRRRQSRSRSPPQSQARQRKSRREAEEEEVDDRSSSSVAAAASGSNAVHASPSKSPPISAKKQTKAAAAAAAAQAQEAHDVLSAAAAGPAANANANDAQ